MGGRILGVVILLAVSCATSIWAQQSEEQKGNYPKSISITELKRIYARMGKMEGQIKNVQETIGSSFKAEMKKYREQMENRIESLRENIDSLSWVYFPPGTKKFKAQKHYPQYALEFIGFGYSNGTDDDTFSKPWVSFEDCIQMCVNKRNQDGSMYNGLQYRFKN